VEWVRTVELFAAEPQNYLEVEFDSFICCLCSRNKIVLMKGVKFCSWDLVILEYLIISGNGIKLQNLIIVMIALQIIEGKLCFNQ